MLSHVWHAKSKIKDTDGKEVDDKDPNLIIEDK